MNSFLHEIAKLYYNNTSPENLHDILFIFPNRRAGLFFRKEICSLATQTIFVPSTSDINRFTASLSRLKKANDIELLLRLYSSYRAVCSEGPKTDTALIESFENFIGLGTSMLSDFNDVDKHLVDPAKLFINVSELKDITDNSNFFSETQLDAIRSFWNNAVIRNEDENLSFKKHFISLWNNLLPIYNHFKKNLINDNLAYEGMLFRDVVENVLQHPHTHYKFQRIVFIGFNSLTASEHAIFRHFQKAGIADFYFDYPVMYDNNSPFAVSVAAYYKNNLREFPSLYEYNQPDGKQCAKCTVYGTPSSFSQSQTAGSIIHDIYTENKNDISTVSGNTAILLADETQLTSVLQNIPAYVRELNVTMGYPLNMSPIANLIENIAVLQTESSSGKTDADRLLLYHKPLINILTHPYIQKKYPKVSNIIVNHLTRYNFIRISNQDIISLIANIPNVTDKEYDFFSKLFKIQTSADELFGYMDYILDIMQHDTPNISNSPESYKFELEYILQYQKYLKQLRLSLDRCGVKIDMKTVHILTKRLTSNLKIQFNGEPLRGLQIMGMLESRLIDFDNIIIIGFNDEKIPGTAYGNSLIPYKLRRAYGLPTYELGDTIYAYNFYRMLYRAKNIHLIYDSRQNDTKREISRFFYQLNYLMPLVINNFEVTKTESSFIIPSQGYKKNGDIVIEKSDEIMNVLNKYKQGQSLSPSRLKHYITCPLKFYFSTVAQIAPPNEIEETVQSGLFGSIFHKAMELYYSDPYPRYIQDKEIELLTQRAFAAESDNNNKNIEIRGFNMLTFNVICNFIKTTISYDLKRTKFQYLGSEQTHTCIFDNVNFVGVIDRIDRTDETGTTNLIDYKTTSTSNRTGIYNIIDLFTSADSACHEIFQVIFYCYLYNYNNPTQSLKPALYNIYNISHINSSDTPRHDLETIKLKVPDSITDKNNMPDYDTDIEILKDPKSCSIIEVHKYNDIRIPFEWLLHRMLREIYDPAVPFTVNRYNSRKTEGCRFCPYTKLCNREKEISQFR